MQKIMLFLSIALILCAAVGIAVFMPEKPKPQVVTEAELEPKKIIKNILVANDEIEVAEPLNLTNTRVQTFEFDNEVPQSFVDLITKEEFDADSSLAAAKKIEANQHINKHDLVYIGSEEYSKLMLQPAQEHISFMFPLNERDYSILSQLKPSDYVDVFFRYETKNPKKDDGIAPKKRKDNEYNNYDSANITSLIPLFIHKKVLFNQKFIETDEVEGAQKEDSRTKGYIFVELSKDDAKKFFTLENLGNFFIFPSESKETVENNRIISTENILQKEFIKELRGNKYGKN